MHQSRLVRRLVQSCLRQPLTRPIAYLLYFQLRTWCILGVLLVYSGVLLCIIRAKQAQLRFKMTISYIVHDYVSVNCASMHNCDHCLYMFIRSH